MSEKPKLSHPSPEEDAAINAAIADDPDTYELNAQEFARLQPMRGFPGSANRAGNMKPCPENDP
jgi:hypothetical protein